MLGKGKVNFVFNRRAILICCLIIVVIIAVAVSIIYGPSYYARITYKEKTIERNSSDPPMMDAYGQVVGVDFPSKVKSDQDLINDLKADREYYDSLNPPERDEYGGLLGSKEEFGLEATGFFRVEKLSDGRTVLVTPLGNIFFSLGVCGTGYVGDTYTLVKGREHIYEWLPVYSPYSKFATAYRTESGEDFSFYIANRIRKTGKPYDPVDFYEETVERLKKWGFNSEGGWSYTEAGKKCKFPTVRHLSMANEIPEGQIEGLYVFDVFVDGIEEKVEKLFERLVTPYRNDPELIGFFLDNEMQYYLIKTVIPQKKASEVAAKKALVDMLKEKYGNNISSFNAAWESNYSSFEELYESEMNVSTDAASKDMEDFIKIWVEKYYEMATRIFRKFDKNHLLLGDRWLVTCINDPTIRDILAEAAGKYMDVISINYYTYDLNLDLLKQIHEKSGGKPIILSEFHYGEPTQGLTHAVKMVDNEEEKGLAYRNYVEKAAATGFVVGTHWFQYLDQAATGRWFQGYTGEAFACGLVNVADRPYKEMLKHVMETNYNIYEILLGEKEPFAYDFGPERTERTANQTVEIPKAQSVITIDGIFDDEWPYMQVIKLGKQNLATGVDNGDVVSEFHFAWDENYLYVHAQIKDPTPMENVHKGADIWNGDAVELFVGPTHVDEGGSLKANDRQIIIRGSIIDGKFESHWYNTSEQTDFPVFVKMDDDKQGYTVEAAIPWTALNVSDPSPGRKLRFDFGVDNGQGEARVAQWFWNGVDGNHVSREKWGKAVLVE